MPIVFNSEEFIPTQRRELQNEMDEFLDSVMEPLFNSIVISEIKSIAIAAATPSSFVEGFKFIKTGKNIGEIINTWGTDDKPLALWFNEGTVQHWIEPKTSDGVLAWGAKNGTHASAIYFKGQSKQGDIMFSKGHYVSGVPKTLCLQRGYEHSKKRLAQEAAKMLKEEFE